MNPFPERVPRLPQPYQGGPEEDVSSRVDNSARTRDFVISPILPPLSREFRGHLSSRVKGLEGSGGGTLTE